MGRPTSIIWSWHSFTLVHFFQWRWLPGRAWSCKDKLHPFTTFHLRVNYNKNDLMCKRFSNTVFQCPSFHSFTRVSPHHQQLPLTADPETFTKSWDVMVLDINLYRRVVNSLIQIDIYWSVEYCIHICELTCLFWWHQPQTLNFSHFLKNTILKSRC